MGAASQPTFSFLWPFALEDKNELVKRKCQAIFITVSINVEAMVDDVSFSIIFLIFDQLKETVCIKAVGYFFLL